MRRVEGGPSATPPGVAHSRMRGFATIQKDIAEQAKGPHWRDRAWDVKMRREMEPGLTLSMDRLTIPPLDRKDRSS